ncbi:MAG: hypothetical protein KAY50_00575 [Chitinophagaceae bacterium]|nr:hypothetical protein [Chitinophagaceae bacterium]
MSLVKRNIIFPKGTTDGFQLIPQPARAPLGGVAYAEKDDDAVPYDQLVQYFIDNMGGGGSGTVTEVTRTLGSTGTDVSLTITNPTTTPNIDLQIPTASSTKRGVLSSIDWSTFNNKGNGTVTAVSGTSPVVSSGGTTPAISMPAANTSVNGYLTSSDWNSFNNRLRQIIEIKISIANTMQNVGGATGTAIPGQFYRVISETSGPLVVGELNCVVLIGNVNGKFSIQGWAELITTKANFYTPCTFDNHFDLIRPHGVADLFVGRLDQSGGSAPSIYNTSLNNLDELPTFSYDGTGEYRLTVTGDQFKADDVFIPIFQIVKLKSGDVIKYVSIEFSDSSNLFIKTYYFDSTTNSAVLSDDILNKTTIRLQRVISNEV